MSSCTLTESGFYRILIAMLLTRLRVYQLQDVLDWFEEEVRQNRKKENGKKQSQGDLFKLLCFKACPEAATFVPPEEELAWKFIQEVALLSTAASRFEISSTGMKAFQREFRSMLKWRQICIDAMRVYEQEYIPLRHKKTFMTPRQCWHDLRELKFPANFFLFARIMSILLHGIAQSQDENDPSLVAAEKLSANLQGQSGFPIFFDQQLKKGAEGG